MEPVIAFSSSTKYSAVLKKIFKDYLKDRIEIVEYDPLHFLESEDFAEKVALVILDTGPNERYDGLVLIQNLKSRLKTCEVPIFVLASSDDKLLRLQALSQDVNDYMTLPVSRKEVVLRTKNLMEHHFERQSMHEGLRLFTGMRDILKTTEVEKQHIEKELGNTIEAQQAVLELSQEELKERDSTLKAQETVIEMSRQEMQDIDQIRSAQETVSEMSRKELMEANTQLKKNYEARLEAIQEKSELQMVFGKYISPAVIEHLINNDGLKSISGEKRDITIMFADIRGFTALSENLEAHKVVLLLNEFFSELTEIIIKYNGIVDKYSGDSIMAIFGAPVEMPGHYHQAVRAAVEMQRSFTLLEKDWSSLFNVSVGLGIGLNCGEAIVGNIGSFHKISYTAIGDVVNMAARFEQSALDKQILFGESYKSRLTTEFLAENNLAVERLGEKKIRGKRGMYTVYNLKYDVSAFGETADQATAEN